MFNMVNKFTCLGDANMSYIGMTSRPLVTRAQEHFYSTINKTAITQHINSCSSFGSSNFSLGSFKTCNATMIMKLKFKKNY